MRTFFYGLIGLIVSFILLNVIYPSLGKESYVIILSTILCGCTGAIVSAIKSEKENITE